MEKHFEYQWWKEAVGYQIYPMTFFDSNNDGIGDIGGIIEKIDYLVSLGIDFIWICPFFKSPMDDNGYDVSDYYNVNELFGSLDDIKRLISVCKSKKIKVIVDLVLNHTSDEHAWFVDVKNNPLSIYREYYIIKPEKEGQKPNNWGSFFGGSVWEPLNEHEYYMKIFSNKMPDLNWKSEKLRQALFDISNWWLDLGVDGFRVDAVAHLAKDESFEDSKLALNYQTAYDWSKFSNLEKVHTYLKTFHQNVITPHKAFTVGEVGGGATVGDALLYCGYDRNELDLTFTFDHIWCNNIETAEKIDDLKVDVYQLKTTLAYWQSSLFKKAWYPLYLNNHDFNRVVSNYGSVLYHEKSAKALATMMYLLWGTPFIYQGEEIGMTNYPFDSINDFNDVSTINQYYSTELKDRPAFLNKLKLSSRDNARTSMQWDNSFLGGFSKKISSRVLTNKNYEIINVKDQLKDSNSILHYYQTIIKIKKTSATFIYGNVTFIDIAPNQLISYYRYDERKCYLVIVNLTDQVINIDLNDELVSCILSNTKKVTSLKKMQIEAYDAYVFEVIRKETLCI